MFEKLKSRKFWFAFLGALLPVVAQYLTDEVSMAESLQISGAIVISYIFGQGWVDSRAVANSGPDA